MASRERERPEFMANRIVHLEIREPSPDPSQSELWVCVHAERHTPTTEVIGRFSGPRCRYATTVEVAYPLRPFTRVPDGLPGIARRVVIPEPSFWEPESPFLYEGTIELWDDHQVCDRAQVRRGLRSLQLGRGGLRVNGRPLVLQGRMVDHFDDGRSQMLRSEGVNLLVAPVSQNNVEMWDVADEVGFFVLGSISADTSRMAQTLLVQEHPSALGFVIEEDDLRQPGAADTIATFCRDHPRVHLGIRLRGVHVRPLPAGMHFIVCDADVPFAMSGVGLPKLLWRTSAAAASELSTAPEHPLLGWVEE